MNWKEEYKRKLTNFEEVAKTVESDAWILTGSGAGANTPEFFDKIIDRWEEVRNVGLVDTLQLQPFRLHDPNFMKKLEGHITHTPGFGVVTVRNNHREKVADVFISATSDICLRSADRVTHLGFMCTPPNNAGYVNLGVSQDYILDNLKLGRKLGVLKYAIAEVNEKMPVVFGDNWIHLSDIDMIVEKNSPIPTLPRGKSSERDKAIGQYVLELINDGDTIQMGIGGISEAVVAGLEGKHDLGILTKMFPSALPDLVDKGIVTNKYKPYHAGTSIATFSLPDQAMMEYMTENPAVQIYPATHCNNISFIAQHPNVVAINTGLLIDFSGQIASEGIGHRHISGAWRGPFEFLLGAWMAPGGKGVSVLGASQVGKDGELVSSIVPELPAGTPVTVPRGYANYVITEYGIAMLRNKTRRERALELISIAHPDLRRELRNSLKTRFYYPEYNWKDEA